MAAEAPKNMFYKQGAESKIFILQWDDKAVIAKQRFKKKWRIEKLNAQITAHRMNQELKSIIKLKNVVKVPQIYMADFVSGTIYMEYFTYPQLQEAISYMPFNELQAIGSKIGSDLAKIHDMDVIHGNLVFVIEC